MTETRMTITEALAEIKTVGRRIAKKQAFIAQHLLRQNNMKDPLADDDGSVEVIKRERQAMRDLQTRIIDLRCAISEVNANTELSVTVADGEQKITKLVTEWLIWRREIAPMEQAFLAELNRGIAQQRAAAQRKGLQLTTEDKATADQDIIVHLSEQQLANEIEVLEEVLGQLDGRLSLHNATTTVEV